MHARLGVRIVRWSLSVGICACLSAGISRAAQAEAIAPAEVLALMERVADHQLHHPVSFDIFSQREAEPRWEITRVGWDGTILVRRPCLPRPLPTGLPDSWVRLMRLERDDVSFGELPEATQAAWRQETGLTEANVTLIQMLDGATRGWEMGVLYHGLLALAEVSGKPVYREALRVIGEANGWRLGERVHHADDHVVGYLYLACHDWDPQVERLAGVQSRFDWIMAHPPNQRMTIEEGQERWTWCDALFMAPPVWALLSRVTGDERYVSFMDTEWWSVVDHLYSPEDNLFFRDATFFDRREPNGAKVFWSRGNGWVLAGLARVLDELPADYPARSRYVALFRTMAERIVSLQPEDGLWRSSLLDPSRYPGPEVSGSAFFCYALAWGVNRGLLDRADYHEPVMAAWAALERHVRSDGHLGYIQQPAAQPGSAGVTSTAPYGVGAFLLAGAEVHRLLSKTP